MPTQRLMLPETAGHRGGRGGLHRCGMAHAGLLSHCVLPSLILAAHTERSYGIFQPSGLYTAPICSVPVRQQPALGKHSPRQTLANTLRASGSPSSCPRHCAWIGFGASPAAGGHRSPGRLGGDTVNMTSWPDGGRPLCLRRCPQTALR